MRTYIPDTLYILTRLIISTTLQGWPYWPHFFDIETEK